MIITIKVQNRQNRYRDDNIDQKRFEGYFGERRERKPVMTGIERVSRPGRRVYTKKQEIPWILSGMGVAILSTPKGIMTGQRARQMGVGGEILCKVW